MSDNLLPVQSYIGTRDFYPEDMRLRNWFFTRMKEVVTRYGYEEVSGPLLESFEVYAAKSGDELVKDQVYHFEDRGGRHVAIRPEMTPTVARMVAARMENLRLPLRWFSINNFMRYERPQKGRLREFWQLNVDLLGADDVLSDFEIVSVAVDLMRAFGADEKMFRVKINNRRLFNSVLDAALELDEAGKKLVSKAIDKRAKIPEDKYREWLKDSGLTDAQVSKLDELFGMDREAILGLVPADDRGAVEVKELFRLIESAGLSAFCEFDFTIVRGLEYYTGTIFEVYDVSPDNRRALFGGGRYDDLVGLFRKTKAPGVGFGFGDVTFQDFLITHDAVPADIHDSRTVFVAVFEEVDAAEYAKLAGQIRAAGFDCTVYLGENKKIGKQFQYAEKCGYPVTVAMGGDEVNEGKATVKDMKTREQSTVLRTELPDILRKLLK